MSTATTIEKYIEGLKSGPLLLRLTWDDWLALGAPYTDGKFSSQDVTIRYNRNGYDWDMHGTLFTPERELNDKRAFVFFHGGAGSEKIMDLTPDGRPGLARVVAAQGFKVLTLTYPATIRPEASGKRRFPSACRSICWIGNCRAMRFSIAI